MVDAETSALEWAKGEVAAAGELQRLVAEGRTFAVEDERFVLIDETRWQSLDRRAGGLRGRACGSMVVGGARYVVLSASPAVPRAAPDSLSEVLTRREVEIAWRIAAGDSNKDIGRSLGISHFTVREHVRRICHKLGVRSRSCVAAAVGSEAFAPRARRTLPAFLDEAQGFGD
jgi:DNA-binding CsgD family transcriptional regulator